MGSWREGGELIKEPLLWLDDCWSLALKRCFYCPAQTQQLALEAHSLNIVGFLVCLLDIGWVPKLKTSELQMSKLQMSKSQWLCWHFHAGAVHPLWSFCTSTIVLGSHELAVSTMHILTSRSMYLGDFVSFEFNPPPPHYSPKLSPRSCFPHAFAKGFQRALKRGVFHRRKWRCLQNALFIGQSIASFTHGHASNAVSLQCIQSLSCK